MKRKTWLFGMRGWWGLWIGLGTSAGAIPTVVLPGQPTATESYAGDELGNYLHEITGQRVRVWPDLPPWGEAEGWKNLDGPVFIVGNTRFSQELKKRCAEAGPEAYSLHSDGNLLYLVGSTDRGTLYAVYEYLSRLGCRWLIPGREGEAIPKRAELPAFQFDEIHRPANWRRDLADFNDIEPYLFHWLAANRINSAAAQSQMEASWGGLIRHYWDVRGGAVLTRFFGHSYAQLVPRELFATHPDWFALIRGERRVEALDGYWNAPFATQFCTSNPEAVQHVIRTVERFFEQNPDYQTFGLIPVDGGSWCECASCQAQDRPPRGHAGRVIALANAVAEAIHPRFPDKEILVLAYADRYLEPPEGLEVHPNVRVQVCLWPHPLQPITGPQTEEGQYYLEQFRRWAARRCRLGTWIYELYSAPTPFDLSLRAMALNARTYRDLGADYVLHECGGARTWQQNPLATWCWMQLAWDPDQDWQALIRDFCEHFYGTAGPTVARLFLRIEERLEKTGALFKEEIYTPAFVEELREGFQRASQEADSELTKGRVRALLQMLPDPATYPHPLPEGQWFHLAATWETLGPQGKIRLFVNGQLVAERTGEWQGWAPEETFYVGRSRHRGGIFTGQLDELRLSSLPRREFPLDLPPSPDPATTFLAHYDQVGCLDADFALGDRQRVSDLPAPYTPAQMAPNGRFGGSLDLRESSALQRFDAVAYRSAGVLNPPAGTIELWMRPDARARFVANGTFLDAGELTFSVANNVLALQVKDLAVTFDMNSLLGKG